MDSETVNEAEETSRRSRRLGAWKLIGLGALVVLLAAQSAVLVLQNQRISDLERRAAIPGPAGPSGAPGPTGPEGPMGPQGLQGIPSSGAPAVVSGPAPTQQMTELGARVTCQTQANQAWPDPHETDPSLQQMTQAYTDTMRQKAFDTCMAQAGYPQQS